MTDFGPRADMGGSGFLQCIVGALGLYQLVPTTLLAGRWLLVLTCYLDDSGKDPQSHITTLAGYVARNTAWDAFEREVEPIFARLGVNVLHAKELEDTKGDFKGWRILKKQAFVAQICSVMAKHSMLGVSMSCVKETYDRRAKERNKRKTVRPYTFCFNVVIDWLLRDIRIGRAVWDEGVALVLETGHENNPEAEEQFYEIRAEFKLERALRSICFVPKDACRAIQMADLLAFYSRRDSAVLEKAQGNPAIEKEPMFKIIAEKGQFRAFVANDFFPRAPSGTPVPLPNAISRPR